MVTWLKRKSEDVRNCDFPKSIWKSPASKKVQIICWLAILEKTNTMDRLQKRMPHICWRHQWCIMCRGNGKNVNHIFINCSAANFLSSKLLLKAGTAGLLPFPCRSLFLQNWCGFGGAGRGRYYEMLKWEP